MKSSAPTSMRPPMLVVLISLLLVSCEKHSYLAVSVDPVDRFKDLVPFEATFERVDIGQKPNTGVMIYLKTAVGERRLIVGSTSSAEMVGFAKTLRKGDTYNFPSAFLDYQKRQSGKQ